ncbi:MAG: hypothetical protein WCI95_05555 [bacterium]
MKHNRQQLDNIPADLKARPQWVGFIVKDGKKKPCIAGAPRTPAKSTDSKTWRSFDAAAAGLDRGDFNAIAYTLNNDFIGVDMDHCFDGDNLNPYAAEVVARCASYSEVSFSGDGLHILMTGTLPGKGRKLPGIEIYNKARFFICTGNRLPNTPATIQSNPSVIPWLLQDNVTENAETTETIEDILPPVPPLSAVSVTYSLDELISKTCPKREGERNVRLFDFARGLRFNMGMEASPLCDLKPLVQKWHAAALPVIRTKDFTSTWTDFIHSWPKARLPLGPDALTVAWKKSKTLPPPAIAGEYDSEPVRQLIGLCAALGSISHDGRFFLSTHAAERLMNVPAMSIHRWLKMLIADGVLKMSHNGNEYRATRYRWITPKAEVNT